MATKKTLIGNIKGPKGDPGDKGETGATGAPGTAATINVGTVTTSAYGTTAQVTNSGTETAAVFDFVIPQGKPGEETTRMSALTLDQVTASTETQPVPAVGEVGAVVWGKVIKFFNDIKTAIANKINYDDCVANLTSTSSKLPLAANQGKALNDAIANKINYDDCVANLTSTSSKLPLAANQGKALNDAIAPPTTETALWGSITSTDHTKKAFTVNSYKFVRLRATFANGGAAEAVVPCSYFGSATTGSVITLHNQYADSTNYFGIMQVAVAPDGINIANESHGSSIGAVTLAIYGAR